MKEQTKRDTVGGILLLLAICAAAVCIYLFASTHVLRIVNMALLYAIAAMGVSVMLGMTGMMSFASIVFFGIGSYAVAEFTTGFYGFTLPPLAALLLSVLIATAVGGILGLLILRLKGTFFSFSTIALVQIAYNLFTNYVPLFGGASGIIGVPTLSAGSFTVNTTKKWFLVCIAAVILAALVVRRIRITQLGRSLASIRDDQIVAASLGINIFRTKLYAFMISAALAGFAGGIYAMVNGYIGSEMFTYAKSTDFIVMAMIGGVNDTLGSIFGALLITVIPEMFRDLADWFRLSYGVVVVLLMIFLPSGGAGLLRMLYRKLFRTGLKKKAGTDGGYPA